MASNCTLNAPNCTILKNFWGVACPRTPIAMRMTNHALKKKLPPPLLNPGDAPGYVCKSQ